MRSASAKAFTLVEILIVVIILGILAAIVLPQFTNATAASRTTSVSTTLQYLRGQIELFKTQHNSVPPQAGSLWTLLQTTSNTTETASASPIGTKYGPYFRNNPINVWNGLTGVSSLATDTTSGWFYTASATDYQLLIRNPDGSTNSSY